MQSVFKISQIGVNLDVLIGFIISIEIANDGKSLSGNGFTP
jgi:hypothetical protein